MQQMCFLRRRRAIEEPHSFFDAPDLQAVFEITQCDLLTPSPCAAAYVSIQRQLHRPAVEESGAHRVSADAAQLSHCGAGVGNSCDVGVGSCCDSGCGGLGG